MRQQRQHKTWGKARRTSVTLPARLVGEVDRIAAARAAAAEIPDTRSGVIADLLIEALEARS